MAYRAQLHAVRSSWAELRCAALLLPRHRRMVEVTHLATGDRSVFGCYGWSE